MDTLADLIRLQRELGCGDVHMVRLEAKDFYVAHTDEERADGTNTADCPIHEWLVNLDGPPAPIGTYIALPDSDEDLMCDGADPYCLVSPPATLSP